MSVEESTVIFGPICQVGWARASAMVIPASSSPLRPRNGPPLAVSTIRRNGPVVAVPPVASVAAAGCQRWASMARRHWWMAQCSESTGMISAPGVARTRCTTGPPAMSDSLLASANRRPASSAARVTGSPAKPTTPLTTTSA